MIILSARVEIPDDATVSKAPVVLVKKTVKFLSLHNSCRYLMNCMKSAGGNLCCIAEMLSTARIVGFKFTRIFLIAL